MSLFRKIFGSKKEESEKESDPKNQNPYLDVDKLPVDEVFTINFNKNVQRSAC